MRYTVDHPDAPHMIVMRVLNDGSRRPVLETSDHAWEIVEVDTEGGVCVLVKNISRWREALTGRGPLCVDMDRERRHVFGRFVVIDRRTGTPYDPLVAAAEEAWRAERSRG